MTTIAFDGKILAADSQCSSGGCVLSKKYQKIHMLKDGRLFAAAGSLSTIGAMVRWLNTGEGACPKWEPGDFEAIVVNPDGSDPYEMFADGVLMPAYVPWVGGSGHQFALAAMHLGFNACKAIECAAALDTNTGGEVQWHQLAE